MTRSVIFWRRLDVPGLERLELTIEPHGVTAVSDLITTENGGFRLAHSWQLDRDWRALSAAFTRWDAAGHTQLRLERAGKGWNVNGGYRPDLIGAAEPDLSATPFCNSFAVRRTPPAIGASLVLDTAFIDAATLTVTRSTQRYDRLGAHHFRYTDLGLFQGFEAQLTLEPNGLVDTYENLFERVLPAG